MANKATGSGGGAYGSTLNNCTITWNTNSNFGAGINGCVAINCLITNNLSSGYYGGGGAYNSQLTNCLVLNNNALAGGGAFDCIMSYCTLAGNLATSYPGGGGAYASTLYNCIISGNRSSASYGYGGGGSGCTLINCLVVSNSAFALSGVYSSTLNNCTVVGQTNGYAAYASTLRNCIIYYNATNFFSGTLVNCCTTPLPFGAGNFTNPPAFVNVAAGNFHLQSNSPCINAGNNLYVTTSTDLDGNPRIVGGTVDIGAYEYQTPASIISYAWLQQYGLPTDGSADFLDADGDGMNNYQEWKAGTNPTNAASVLKLLAPTKSGSGLIVTWQSVSGVTYYLQRSTNLWAHPAISSIQSNIIGQAVSTTYRDNSATNGGPFFYRVGVQ